MKSHDPARAKARKAFVAKCKKQPSALQGTKVILDGSEATVKNVGSSKSTDGSFHVSYSKHAVQGSGSFCTSDANWHPQMKESESPCLSQAKIDRHVASLPEPLVIPLATQYLHLFLACPGKGQKNQSEFDFQDDFISGKDDQYGQCAYSEIVFNAGVTVCWGPRLFFQKTNFCQATGIGTYLDIPSKGTGGLNEDTAIFSHPKPDLYACNIAIELRSVLRKFLPIESRWTSIKQLMLMNRKVLAKDIRQALDKIKLRKWAISCGAGRTRSATVVLFLMLAVHVVEIAVDDNRMDELRALAEDFGTNSLQSFRERLDDAMANRRATPTESPRKDAKIFKVDRDDRFFPLLQCFSIGKTFADGKKKVSSSHAGKPAARRGDGGDTICTVH